MTLYASPSRLYVCMKEQMPLQITAEHMNYDEGYLGLVDVKSARKIIEPKLNAFMNGRTSKVTLF